MSQHSRQPSGHEVTQQSPLRTLEPPHVQTESLQNGFVAINALPTHTEQGETDDHPTLHHSPPRSARRATSNGSPPPHMTPLNMSPDATANQHPPALETSLTRKSPLAPGFDSDGKTFLHSVMQFVDDLMKDVSPDVNTDEHQHPEDEPLNSNNQQPENEQLDLYNTVQEDQPIQSSPHAPSATGPVPPQSAKSKGRPPAPPRQSKLSKPSRRATFQTQDRGEQHGKKKENADPSTRETRRSTRSTRVPYSPSQHIADTSTSKFKGGRSPTVDEANTRVKRRRRDGETPRVVTQHPIEYPVVDMSGIDRLLSASRTIAEINMLGRD